MVDIKNQLVGNVLAVAGSAMTVALDDARSGDDSVRVGAMLKASNGERDVVACISQVKAGNGYGVRHVLIVDLLGELITANGSGPQFSRGVSTHPIPGESVFVANSVDLRAVYGDPSEASVSVGRLYQDPSRPALVRTNDLLGKHFAILGTTGSGKSCALTLILSAILQKHPNAHVVLLDPHNEYSKAFGDLADVISADNLQLPLWLLNFEEAARVLIRSGSETEQNSQLLILNDAITWARRNYKHYERSGPAITVDTPLPYRVHQLLRFINDEMGRLAKPDTAIPYLRLRARIESLRNDRRFEFLFSSEEDVLADIVGRLLRIPVNSKPLTIVDLSGAPSEIADVIVSTLSRVLFDFSIWCEHEKMPPLLLVCEEAHRYVPADERFGFAQTVRTITQIAKEGRKYGISLALITQRPSELSLPALSQCGTVFALRLGSEIDQEFIARTLPDVARDMLSALPSLPTQQAIVSGEGVRIPMRIRFDDLPENQRPHSDGAVFSQQWQTDTADRKFIERGIRRWRAQTRS
jgi:DNA helicase HerA-like ATPase